MAILLIILYGVLKMSYATYEREYAWTISVAYMSGLTPGAVLIVVFTVLLLIVLCINNYIFRYSQTAENIIAAALQRDPSIFMRQSERLHSDDSSSADAEPHNNSSNSSKSKTAHSKYKRYVMFGLVFIMNFSITVTFT